MNKPPDHYSDLTIEERMTMNGKQWQLNSIRMTEASAAVHQDWVDAYKAREARIAAERKAANG